MKQHVEVTLKINLWLDAAMDEDQIVTHVRSALPAGFGEDLTAMLNPVDILNIREEAEIYGTKDPKPQEGSSLQPFSVFQLANDEATYGPDAGKFIVTSADYEEEFAGPMSQKDAEGFAAVLNACQMVVDRWEKGDLAEAARACAEAVKLAGTV